MAARAAASLRQLSSSSTSSTFARNVRPASAAATPLTLPNSALAQTARRSFQTSRILRQEGVIAPRKPVGAFRGTLFGFLLGSVLATAGLYYYVIEEYKVSNELLTEDIYALHAAVWRLEAYMQAQEEEKKGGQK